MDIPNNNEQIVNATTTTLSTEALNSQQENDQILDKNGTSNDAQIVLSPEREMSNDSVTISSLSNQDGQTQTPTPVTPKQLYTNGNHHSSETG